MKFKIGDKVKIIATKEELRYMGITIDVDTSKVYTILQITINDCLLNITPTNYWCYRQNLISADRQEKLERILK
jgi:hypothetical protein